MDQIRDDASMMPGADNAALRFGPALSYIHRCRTYEGGYGQTLQRESFDGPTYCALASLHLVPADHVCALQARLQRAEWHATVRWLLHMQVPTLASVGGGSFAGRTNKLADACYGFWWCGAALDIRSLAFAICSMRAALGTFLPQCQYKSVESAKHQENIPVSPPLPSPYPIRRISLDYLSIDRSSGDRIAGSCVGTAAARPLINATHETAKWAKEHVSAAAPTPPEPERWPCPMLVLILLVSNTTTPARNSVYLFAEAKGFILGVRIGHAKPVFFFTSIKTSKKTWHLFRTIATVEDAAAVLHAAAEDVISEAVGIEVLASTLNPDSNVRITAELNLAEFRSEESALSLAQLVLSQDAESSLRQMSLILSRHSEIIILRKYVKEHWSLFFLQFRGDPPPPEIKDQIRRAVFQGLSDPDRKIRSLCVRRFPLSRRRATQPDEYPELLNLLVQLLLSGSPSSIHGAMQVFTEFVRTDLTEDQLLPVMRELLPVLMSILSVNEQHSPLTRSRTISVFRQCVESLYMVKDQHPQAAKEAAGNVLPVWLDAFKVLLDLDPQQDISGEHWDGLEIRIQIFRTLDTMHTSFPRVVAPYLAAFVTAALDHLDALYPTYVRYYLTDSVTVPNSSEGEAIELYKLITPVLDFVTIATRQSKARVSFDQETLGKLVDALVRWAQMTKENEEEWAADANLFISQEEDDTQAYSVRVAVFDLVSSLLASYPVQTVSALHTSVQHVVTETNKAREAGLEDWWRPLEGAFAVLGSECEVVLDISNDEHDAGRPRPIDMEYILARIIPSLLTLSAYPFLQGRCLFLASRFAELLPADVRGQYLEAAIQVIESNETEIPFKVSAVKSIQQFVMSFSKAFVLTLGLVSRSTSRKPNWPLYHASSGTSGRSC
ncbi:armadillo-type protein [Russula compacta]|nr:armadillo-type protein [Russula compacta]